MAAASYLSIGVMYNRKYHGLSGLDAVPQRDFWCACAHWSVALPHTAAVRTAPCPAFAHSILLSRRRGSLPSYLADGARASWDGVKGAYGRYREWREPTAGRQLREPIAAASRTCALTRITEETRFSRFTESQGA